MHDRSIQGKAKMSIMKLRPGILVSLRTRVVGGVEYERVQLESQRNAGFDIEKWETTRTIADVEAHERAKVVRSKANSLVRGVCIKSEFGLLCPNKRRDELADAIREARKIVEFHNSASTSISVSVHVIRGEIVDSDTDALQAIADEVQELLAEMDRGVRAGASSVVDIRAAASRAKALGAMLDSRSEERVDDAVQSARRAARDIVRRVKKNGEDALAEIVSENCGTINSMRVAFLEFDEGSEVDVLPAIDRQRMQEIQLDRGSN